MEQSSEAGANLWQPKPHRPEQDHSAFLPQYSAVVSSWLDTLPDIATPGFERHRADHFESFRFYPSQSYPSYQQPTFLLFRRARSVPNMDLRRNHPVSGTLSSGAYPAPSYGAYPTPPSAHQVSYTTNPPQRGGYVTQPQPYPAGPPAQPYAGSQYPPYVGNHYLPQPYLQSRGYQPQGYTSAPQSTREGRGIRSLGTASGVSPSASPLVSGSRPLVEQPDYRRTNLVGNDIVERSSYELLPPSLDPLVNQVRRARHSPASSLDSSDQRELWDMHRGAPESKVENFFRKTVFPDCVGGMVRDDHLTAHAHQVPQKQGASYRVSKPVPDSLYGYDRNRAFPSQEAQIVNNGSAAEAGSTGLLYPFFAIEFKGEGPTAGGLWVATNQCLGDSAMCIKIAEQLNTQLRACDNANVQQVDSTAFSIAMNNSQARLFISWKDRDLKYYTQRLDSYLLDRPSDFENFRQHVKNILDWGQNERLKQIQEALDHLLELNRFTASRAAKGRSPPSSSAPSGGRARKRMMSNSELQ